MHEALKYITLRQLQDHLKYLLSKGTQIDDELLLDTSLYEILETFKMKHPELFERLSEARQSLVDDFAKRASLRSPSRMSGRSMAGSQRPLSSRTPSKLSASPMSGEQPSRTLDEVVARLTAPKSRAPSRMSQAAAASSSSDLEAVAPRSLAEALRAQSRASPLSRALSRASLNPPSAAMYDHHDHHHRGGRGYRYY